MNKVTQITRLNKHDLKVVLFHVLVVSAQAALLQLKVENFGPTWTPIVVMVVQVASEALRRVVV